MTNTLIDNSDNLKLVDTIKEILQEPKINQIDIATGYWDIPGTSILADELDKFLERDGTKLRILIGKDPYLFAQYNKNPKYKDFQNWPEEYIRTDINDIEVKEDYENAVAFLLKYLDKTEENISKSGDVLRLSLPDKKIIALALMLIDEGKSVKVISDDYTIQNTLKIMNIPYSGIITEGIKEI